MQNGWLTDTPGRYWLLDTKHLPAHSIDILKHCRLILTNSLNGESSLFQSSAEKKEAETALEGLGFWLDNLINDNRKTVALHSSQISYAFREYIHTNDFSSGLLNPESPKNLWPFTKAARPALKSKHQQYSSGRQFSLYNVQLRASVAGPGIPTPFLQWLTDEIRQGEHDAYFDEHIAVKVKQIQEKLVKEPNNYYLKNMNTASLDSYIGGLAEVWIREVAKIIDINIMDTNAVSIPVLRPSRSKPTPLNIQTLANLQQAMTNQSEWITLQKKARWELVIKVLAKLCHLIPFSDVSPKDNQEVLKAKDSIYLRLGFRIATDLKSLSSVNVPKNVSFQSEGEMMQSTDTYILYGTLSLNKKGFWTGGAKSSSHLTGSLCFPTEKDALTFAKRKLNANYSVVKATLEPKMITQTFGTVDINELGTILSIKEREELQRAMIEARIQEATKNNEELIKIYEEKLLSLGVDPQSLKTKSEEDEPPPTKKATRI